MSPPRRFGIPCLILGLAMLPAGPAARMQAPTTLPTFPSEVALITVDVVALEAAGRSSAGLTRDDFVLSEDGHPQETASLGRALDGMADGRYDLVLDGRTR
jgi:hypothetical protein